MMLDGARSGCLCHLPKELKLIIVELIYESSPIIFEDERVFKGDVLLALGTTSRAWRAITIPFIFREVDFVQETNYALSNFAKFIAPKYGQHCRTLLVSLRPAPFGSLGDNTEELDELTVFDHSMFPNAKLETAAKSVSWQAKRSAYLSMILHFMPRMDELEVAIHDCRWHRSELDPCRCLTTYEGVLLELADLPLKIVTIEYGDTMLAENGSEEFVRRLLLSAHHTIEDVTLSHNPMTYWGGFSVPTVLKALQDLPRLQKLHLWNMCSMAALSDLEWTSPLQALEIVPGHEYEDSAHIPDDEISLVLPRLPTSLRHLSLKGLKLTNSGRRLPHWQSSPGCLQSLAKLVLDFPVDSPVIAYFRKSTIVTLDLQHSFDTTSFIMALTNPSAFPCLQALIVNYPTGERFILADSDAVVVSTAKARLRDACKPRGIKLFFR